MKNFSWLVTKKPIKIMIKALLIILLIFSQSSWTEENLDVLLDGLHQDAHEGNFKAYFDRYSADAVF